MQDNYDPLAVPPDAWEKNSFEKELATIGEHQAVCSQIHNLGYQDFNGKISPSPKIAFIFEIDQKIKEGDFAGKPLLMTQEFLLYMAEGSKLRTFLENWRGRPFTQDEAQGFTLRTALRKPCTLLVTHDRKKDGTPKAKIAGIGPAKGPAIAPVITEIPKFISDKIAAQKQPPIKRAMAPAGGPPPQGEDDLPF